MLRTVCDVAYVLQVEQVERHVLADRQIVALARIMGGAEAEMPSVDGAIAEFDALLIGPAVVVVSDPGRRELLELMGVA